MTVISINDRQLHVSKVIPIDGTKEFEFPIRRDMDRVQALDQILGNLWNFGDINKIFVDGDHLTNICGSLTNIANLKLYLGNPLDIVVNLSIEVSSELAEIRLKEEKFANDACQSEFLRNNKVVCELKANNRVIIANTNSVNLDGGASPVWIGDLEENIGKISVIGQKIKFFVNFQFKNEEEREFSINKTVETVILGCSG